MPARPISGLTELGAAEASAATADDWPHTGRVLPWALAGFVAMLWLIPFDAVNLPFSLPVEAKLDRFALAGVGFVWLAALAARDRTGPRLRPSPLDAGLGLFFGIAVASVLLSAGVLQNLQELDGSVKNLALLAAYIGFFYIAASVMRPGEVQHFVTLMLLLACVTALGTIWEYRTDANIFYQWTDRVLPSAIGVVPDTVGVDSIGRRAVSGPTGHGLAVTTMLAIALPFALVRVMERRDLMAKAGYSLITAILLAGAVSTVRKTAVVVPLAALVVMAAYRPRTIVRLWPLGIVLVVTIHALSPGAMGSIRNQLLAGGSSTPVEGRTEDYAAVRPDLLHGLVIGRGYGSYDPHKYRFLDNQYLALRITTGWLGATAYLLVILLTVLVAHRAVRAGDPRRAPPALAAGAAAVGFGVASVLFDVLAFPHAPYAFFFVAALAVVSAAGRSTDSGPGAALVPLPRPVPGPA